MFLNIVQRSVYIFVRAEVQGTSNKYFIANLIQNAINQNDMREKPKRNRLFDLAQQ